MVFPVKPCVLKTIRIWSWSKHNLGNQITFCLPNFSLLLSPTTITKFFLPNLLNNAGFILSTISYKWGRLYIFCPFDELVWLKHLLSVTCKVFVIGIMFTKGWHAVNCNKGFYFFNVWGWGGLCSGHRWREFLHTMCASFSWILIFNNLVWMYWKRKYKFKLVLFSSFSHIVE